MPLEKPDDGNADYGARIDAQRREILYMGISRFNLEKDMFAMGMVDRGRVRSFVCEVVWSQPAAAARPAGLSTSSPRG